MFVKGLGFVCPSHKNYMHEGSVIILLTLSLNVFGGRQTKQTYLVNLSLN
jgi:hypothetical protein